MQFFAVVIINMNTNYFNDKLTAKKKNSKIRIADEMNRKEKKNAGIGSRYRC